MRKAVAGCNAPFAIGALASGSVLARVAANLCSEISPILALVDAGRAGRGGGGGGIVHSAASARGGSPAAVAGASEAGRPAGKVMVYVLPVRDEIAQPVLYILRRGLKEAIENKADAVVLDMKTPGGALDITFEIMEATWRNFPGRPSPIVDNEAVSAGAFISATTQEIWFAPDGVIGAAAPVTMTGQDIDETMKLKMVSYLKARVRAISEGKGFRGQVISAMIDKDYELKIGDTVIKPKGELLSLTASEAAKTYGDPPQPLLAAGMAKNIDDLLRQKFGAGGYRDRPARGHLVGAAGPVWLNAMAPVLHGAGRGLPVHRIQDPGLRFLRHRGHRPAGGRVPRSLRGGLLRSRADDSVRRRPAAGGRGGVLLSRRGGAGGERSGPHARLAGVGDGRHLAQRTRDHRDFTGDLFLQPLSILVGRPRPGARIDRAARTLPAQRLALGPDGVAGGGRNRGPGGRHGAGGGGECRRAHWQPGRGGHAAAPGRARWRSMGAATRPSSSWVPPRRHTGRGDWPHGFRPQSGETFDMTAILLLFLLGMVLLVFEVFMPSSVLGILGGVAMLVGLRRGFHALRRARRRPGRARRPRASSGWRFTPNSVCCPRRGSGSVSSCTISIGATSQPPLAEADAVVGKLCEAATTLAPSGYVLLEGRRYEAFSQSGHVAKGTTLKVVAVDNFRLTVTKP